jgi:hypothetical protein
VNQNGAKQEIREETMRAAFEHGRQTLDRLKISVELIEKPFVLT